MSDLEFLDEYIDFDYGANLKQEESIIVENVEIPENQIKIPENAVKSAKKRTKSKFTEPPKKVKLLILSKFQR